MSLDTQLTLNILGCLSELLTTGEVTFLSLYNIQLYISYKNSVINLWNYSFLLNGSTFGLLAKH